MSIFDLFDDDFHAKGAGDTGKPVAAPTEVFRVEMPSGDGPFNDDSMDYDKRVANYNKLEDWGCTDLARDNGEQMGETEQAFYDAHGDASYGCDSTTSIGRWFCKPARAYLAKRGAKLIEYRIPTGGYELTVGNGEVVFDRKHCQRVAEHDLVTMA